MSTTRGPWRSTIRPAIMLVTTRGSVLHSASRLSTAGLTPNS